MAAEFDSVVTSEIGITPVTLYTATVKTILIGCSVSNLTTATLPLDVYISRGVNTSYVCKGKRIELGDNYEVVQKGKFVLNPGDIIVAKTLKEQGFSALVSVLKGVA